MEETYTISDLYEHVIIISWTTYHAVISSLFRRSCIYTIFCDVFRTCIHTL